LEGETITQIRQILRGFFPPCLPHPTKNIIHRKTKRDVEDSERGAPSYVLFCLFYFISHFICFIFTKIIKEDAERGAPSCFLFYLFYFISFF
jgi:hypothetical protein